MKTPNLQQSLVKALKDDVVLLLRAPVLKTLKINFGKENIAEFNIDDAAFQVRRFNANSKSNYALIIRKISVSDDLSTLKKINFNDPTLTINNKTYYIKPFDPAEDLAPTITEVEQIASSERSQDSEKINLKKEKKKLQNTYDPETLDLKLQKLYESTSEKLISKELIVEEKAKLYELLSTTKEKPAPTETPKLLISEVPKHKPHINQQCSQELLFNEFAYNPICRSVAPEDFVPEIDLEKVIKPPKHTAFWFQIDGLFTSSDELWAKLRIHYLGSPKDTEYKLKTISSTKSLPVSFSLCQRSQGNAEISFVKKLENKLTDLTQKNALLEKQISELEQANLDAGLQPKDSPEYLTKIEEKIELAKCIKRSRDNLESFIKKIAELKLAHGDKGLQFYVHVFGIHGLLTKYDELIGDKLLSLNDQINHLCSLQEELERTLVQKIQQIHNARKSRAKQHFLEQEASLADHSDIYQKSAEAIAKLKKQKTLQEVGELHESAALVQEKINQEYKKLNYFLDNLKTIEDIDDYDDRLEKISQKKLHLHSKKQQYQKYLHHLRLRVNELENATNAFIASITDSAATFRKDVLHSYKSHKALLFKSTQRLWDEWNTRGLELIEDLFEQKKLMISKFADLSVIQVRNIYKNQRKLLLDAQSRQKEWDKVTDEVYAEFKFLGYQLNAHKEIAVNYDLISEINTRNLKLSDETSSALFYQPNFNVSTKPDYLFGLEPKVIDDDQFLIIDQVWEDLTPEQENLVKSKLLKESKDAEEIRAKEKIAEIKENIELVISSQRAKMKVSSIFDSFPKASNSQNIEEKSVHFEKYLLHSWKEKRLSDSTTVGETKESLYNMARNLLSLKSVRMVNSRLEISDTGLIKDDINAEAFSEKDWFIKAQPEHKFEDSVSELDLSLTDSEIYEMDDDDYLKIVDSLDTIQDSISAKSKKPIAPPSLEEWAQISIKKFREKRKFVDHDALQNKILLLEEEINKIVATQSKHVEAHNIDLAKRNYLDQEIQTDLLRMRQFLSGQEGELNSIILHTQKEIDTSLELRDKNL